jgi:hypothetical protein
MGDEASTLPVAHWQNDARNSVGFRLPEAHEASALASSVGRPVGLLTGVENLSKWVLSSIYHEAITNHYSTLS